MRILHVVHPGEFGGANTVVSSLSLAEAGIGQRVRVAAVVEGTEERATLSSALTDSAVSLETIAIDSKRYDREWRRIRALGREWRPDVLHSHGYRADVVASAAARTLGIPTVTTLHGFTGGGWKNRLYERLQRFCLRYFDAVVAVSRPLYDSAAEAGIARERLALIPNGWLQLAAPHPRPEARRILDLPPSIFVVGWVGRLSEEKGIDVFVKALERLPRPWVACVIGDGPRRERTEVEVRNAGLGRQVRLPGAVSEASRLFPAFDCLALSSRTEGTPMVLLEAMAARVPIVATRVGGVPDLLSDDDALLVPSEDPGALALALASVRDHPEEAERRAEAASARLTADYDHERWAERYVEVYRAAHDRVSGP